MAHPTLSDRRADAVVELLRAGQPLEIDVAEAGFVIEDPGGSYTRHEVESAASLAHQQWADHVGELGRPLKDDDRRRLEACMAGHLHDTLRQLPVATLADLGFWRYLTIFPYRWYLVAREPEMQPQDYGGTRPHPEDPSRRLTTDPKVQLLLRTYLWGKAAYDPSEPNPYRRATAIGDKGPEIDIWHSHVVRIQLGHTGEMAHHFIDSLVDEPQLLKRDPARAFEKRLTRMKHNIVLDVYEGTDCRELVDGQRASVLQGLTREV